MYTASDFMKLWTCILKNSILNRLLIGKLLGKNSFLVTYSLVKLSKENSLALAKAKNLESGPSFRLSNIMVLIKDSSCTVGYPFLSQFVTENIDIPQNTTLIKKLKFLTNAIFNRYSPLACKIDKVFSELPPSVILRLERENISRAYWKRGLGQKIKDTSGNIDETELKDYYELLGLRLLDWRILNTILIELLKKGYFEKENPEVGKLTVTEILTNDKKIVQIIFSDYVGEKFYSTILDYGDMILSTETTLPPQETLNEILFELRKLFNAQFR